MSSKVKKSFEKKIIRLLKQNSDGLSRKEISQMLKIHKNTYHLFRDSLNNLLKKNKIQKKKDEKKLILIKSGQSFSGELKLTKDGFGFVHDEGEKIDVFINREHLNTALHTDIVEVKLFAHSKGKNAEGFVTDIIERGKEYFVGTYHETEYYGYVIPDDKRVYRDIFIPKELKNDAQNGHKVVVRMLRWERDHLNPEGSISEILGYPGEKGVDVASIAYSHQLNLKFSSKIEDEASREKLLTDEKLLKNRLDLREEMCITIDPADAKDFDDAVSLKKLRNGNLELGVHIADVSYYVSEKSEVDKEAFKRGTSVYLVDRVIPMLPESLSNNICSLRPNEDRLTYSCIMELDKNENIVNYEITPSVIHNKKRFSYEEVQNIVENDRKNKHFDLLSDMIILSRKITQKRLKHGSIDFETPEVEFELDNNGFPVAIKRKKRLDSHRMIEEFMLLANKTVATHIKNISGKEKLLPFIYRIHEKPDNEKMTKFFTFLKALGFQIKPIHKVTSKNFQKLLSSLKGTKEEIVIEEVALRSMMKAAYSPANIGHFGLGFSDYTHFTSPIRRYPDLMVHRLLKNYQNNEDLKIIKGSNKKLKKICDQSSKMERVAIEAERDSIKLKKNEYISKHLGQEYEGIISGVTSFGVFVEIIENLVEGLIHMNDLDDDYYIYDEKTYSLVGRETDKILRLGDVVKIKVERVNLETGKVDFKLVN